MSFFSGASNPTSSPSDMQARKEEMKQRISQELAVANAQTLINVSRLCGLGCLQAMLQEVRIGIKVKK